MLPPALVFSAINARWRDGSVDPIKGMKAAQALPRFIHPRPGAASRNKSISKRERVWKS
jgi:hypothetical protein